MFVRSMFYFMHKLLAPRADLEKIEQG